MQMYGVLQHFGKNAFADGVFVFEEKTGTKHKIGDYTDVITTIDSRLAANPIGGSYESNENWKDAEKEYLKLYHTSLIKMHKKVIAIQQSVQKYQENPLQIDENIKKLKVEKIDQNICDTNLAYYFKEIQIAKPRISLQEHKPTPTNSQRNSAQNRITAHLQPDIKNQSGQFIKRGSSSASILHNQDRLQINQQNIETSFRANSTLPDIKSSHADKLRNKFDKYLNNTNPSTNF
jgi:hypothetical protein